MSVDRYDLKRKIGSGHFTAGVYLAKHKDLDREYAVKLLKVPASADRDDLLQEAKYMAALERHDHVVQVLDAGDWDADHVYIASEFCQGGSLEQVAAGEVDPARACSLISDSCRGLSHMHREGLLHLDLRPANILVNDDRPKIADFGLSRWVGAARAHDVYAEHAAPELYAESAVTAAADQYAMAMTLAHLLTAGGTCRPVPQDPVAASRAGTWPDLSSLGHHVPIKLEKVVRRATLFDPAARFPDIDTFKSAVDMASPAVSFRPVDQVTLESTDGIWTIVWTMKDAAHTVDVFKRGRRDRVKGVYGVTEDAAVRHRRKLVTSFASR